MAFRRFALPKRPQRGQPVFLAVILLSGMVAACVDAFLVPPRSCGNPIRGQRLHPGNGADQQSTTASTSTGASSLDSPANIHRRVFTAEDSRPVVLFDGVCNLCNGAVNRALDWDAQGILRFAALQSAVGRALLQHHGRDADDISSIVLVTPDGAYVKSDAILRITEALQPVRGLLPLQPAAVAARYLVPRLLRDIMYDGVANNRYQILGKRKECRCNAADGEFENRFVSDQLARKP